MATTDSDHDGPVFPNLAKDAAPNGPNQLWVADITYIAIASGFVYLAAILDAWSRRVVGYAIGRRIDARLALAALKAAIAVRKPPPGCIHHSDRGSQYAAEDYRAELAKYERRGHFPAPMERSAARRVTMAVLKLSRLVFSAAIVASLTLLAAPHVAAQTLGTRTPDAPAATAKPSAAAKSGGLAVHYDIFGDLKSGKTPLLVLHGAYMSADSMATFVERFARTRPVIVLDQRGHGRTGDAKGPITCEALADDSAAVLDAAGVPKADVFGYSMGGAAAIQLAIRHPDKVAKLVSTSASTRLDAALSRGPCGHRPDHAEHVRQHADPARVRSPGAAS